MSLEAAEVWMCRRISWECNAEVLIQVQEKREILKVLKKRKIKLSGNLFRHNSLIGVILLGKLLGKKGRNLDDIMMMMMVVVAPYEERRIMAVEREVPGPAFRR